MDAFRKTAAALVLGFTALTLSAQDAADEDIFGSGAFDSAVTQGQSSAEANKPTWLTGVTLASNNFLVLPAERAAYGSQGLFDGKGFLKASDPALGALYLSYSVRHTLWSASNDGPLASAYTRAKPDASVPTYALSEFHLSFDLGKTVFLRLGNQLLDWGASAVWSPADFLNRKSEDASIDTRAGKPGLRVHVPLANGNLFVFADASRSISSGVVKDLVETGSLAFRTDTTVAGWNLGLVGNFGKSSDPRLGLTATGALAGIDLWGEVGTVLPLQDRNFSWAASLGGERSWGTDSEWTLRAEGFFNPHGRDDTAVAGPVLASFTPYYWGRYYGYTEVLKKKALGPDVNASLSVLANLSDRSWQATAKLATTLPGTLPLNFSVKYNGGPADREFTWTTGGPAWTLGVGSLVSF